MSFRSILLTLILACPIAGARADPPDPLLTEVTGLGGLAMFLQSGAPGMVLVVVRGDRSLVLGYGETTKGNNHEPDGTSLFRLNSITKLFTTEMLAPPRGRGQAAPHRPAADLRRPRNGAHIRPARHDAARSRHPFGRAATRNGRATAQRQLARLADPRRSLDMAAILPPALGTRHDRLLLQCRFRPPGRRHRNGRRPPLRRTPAHARNRAARHAGYRLHADPHNAPA